MTVHVPSRTRRSGDGEAATEHKETIVRVGPVTECNRSTEITGRTAADS